MKSARGAQPVSVELLWFEGCPNKDDARTMIEQAIANTGVPARVISTEVGDDSTAAALHFPGSPTVRVNGVDVAPFYRDPPAFALACRLYDTSSGPCGLPEAIWIHRALRAAAAGANRS